MASSRQTPDLGNIGRWIRGHYYIPKPSPASAWKPPRGLGQPYYISFYGHDPTAPTLSWSFSVLAGDTPPTIIGGYAQWATVPRPLWRGLTVFQGYDPPSMQMSLRFMVLDHTQLGGIGVTSWLTDNGAGSSVEIDCTQLEQLAGQGRESGPPPLVYLSTLDQDGNTTALIPFEYQDSPTANVPKYLRNQYLWPWVITDIQWDQNPVRNTDGFRVRQDATVTVQLYQSTQNPPSVTHRAASSQKAKALPFYTRTGATNALEIAAQSLSAADRFALAQAIIKYPGNAHLHLHSTTQTIKVGKQTLGIKVLVPYSY